jgi:hypothetical protein
MTAKGLFWMFLGPAVWTAILLWTASDKAHGVGETGLETRAVHGRCEELPCASLRLADRGTLDRRSGPVE